MRCAGQDHDAARATAAGHPPPTAADHPGLPRCVAYLPFWSAALATVTEAVRSSLPRR